MQEPKEKAEGKETERPKKPPGWRNFQELLKQVIKAPPMREHPLRKIKNGKEKRT